MGFRLDYPSPCWFKDDRCLGVSLEIKKLCCTKLFCHSPPKIPGSPDVSLMSQKNVTQKMVWGLVSLKSHLSPLKGALFETQNPLTGLWSKASWEPWRAVAVLHSQRRSVNLRVNMGNLSDRMDSLKVTRKLKFVFFKTKTWPDEWHLVFYSDGTLLQLDQVK